MNAETISADGYRVLQNGELIQPGDEFQMEGLWYAAPAASIGRPFGNNHMPYRRAVGRIVDAEPPKEHFIVCRQFGFSGSERYRYQAAPQPFTHLSETAAVTECERLANEHGGKFVVFKAVDAFEKPAVPAHRVEV